MFLAQPIERISADDLMSLAADMGSAPMQVGAILTLSIEHGQTPAGLLDRLAQRIHAVPRLRQRLVSVPRGCGRPVWMNDHYFDPRYHLDTVPCPPPGGEEAVLRTAAEILVTPLPHDRPLWVAKLITGIDEDPHHAALVFVFHHVLTDGIGGLAVLQTLAGPAGEREPGEEPAPPYSPLLLAADNARNHLKELARMPASLRRLAAGAWELRVPGRKRLARTSLNRPTGPRRQLVVVRFELETVKTAARAHGATVNDLVLTATAAALNRLLGGRGETVEEFMISVPFSARRQTTINHLGNQNGVIPVPVPATGPAAPRLAAVAAATRAAKQQPPGASTALLGPLSHLLARIGCFRYVIEHQRLVHTFVSDLRGPEQFIRLAGARVTGFIPLGAISGNVTVAFAVLSYAGTLTITAIADPEACPDLAVLADSLTHEIQAMTKPQESG
jgi:WS/DGAT/MGAT family acyltransferase